MKSNFWIVSVLFLSICFSTEALANDDGAGLQGVKADDGNTQAKVADTHKNNDQVKKKDLQEQKKEKAEGSEDKEVSTTIKVDQTDDQVGSVQDFNSGLSSMVADMMEDESLQEEDEQKEDLKEALD